MKKNARRKSPAKITKAKPLKSKQPAMSLRRGPDKYRILVENSPDGYFILKGEKILLANKAFASMTGYPGKRLLGMDFKSLLPPEETAFLEKIRKI